jgi:hypothetical protein
MSAFLRLWHAAPKTSATALALTGGASAWVASSDDPRQAAYSLYACPVRLGRCATAGAIVLAGEISALDQRYTLCTLRIYCNGSFDRVSLVANACSDSMPACFHTPQQPSAI